MSPGDRIAELEARVVAAEVDAARALVLARRANDLLAAKLEKIEEQLKRIELNTSATVTDWLGANPPRGDA